MESGRVTGKEPGYQEYVARVGEMLGFFQERGTVTAGELEALQATLATLNPNEISALSAAFFVATDELRPKTEEIDVTVHMVMTEGEING